MSLRRRQPLVEGEQPADLAVLPRERRRRGSVPGLRRPAGQQLAGSATRPIPGGITNAAGRTCTAATASGCSPIPTDPDYVYAEVAGRLHRARRTASTHEIARHPAEGAATSEKLRFNWNTPMHLSPNEKGTIYIGAQFLFRSRDHGQTLGAHLARPDDQRSARSRSRRSRAASPSTTPPRRCTRRSTRSASRRRTRKVDLGRHRRRQRAAHARRRQDAGPTSSATCTGLPKASWVSWVEASRFDAGHRLRDVRPPHVRRHDARRSTGRPTSARPGRASSPPDAGRARLRARHQGGPGQTPDLLFLGTEFGLWISIDGGADAGREFKGGDFPASRCATSSIQPRDDDLVIATHGRGIWIIDDITPLRALTPRAAGAGSGVPARRGRCSSASPGRAAGPRATRSSSARTRRAAP